MGAADIVPGVSGGTVALVTGIYERLIKAIKSIGIETVSILFKHGIKAAFKQIDGAFLVTLLAGILSSIVIFSRLLHFAIEHYPMLIWPSFFGLVLASSIYVGREVKHWNMARLGLLLLGIIIAATISLSSAAQVEVTPLSLFLAGALAICAMILPGISGSFILLLLGMYGVVITAVKTFDITSLAIFALGCAMGLMLFSRFLVWLLARFHQGTMALLTGFMLGALLKLWPWKDVLSYRINSKGISVPFIEAPIAPWQHADPQLLTVIMAGICGFALVFVLEFVFNNSPIRDKSPEK